VNKRVRTIVIKDDTTGKKNMRNRKFWIACPKLTKFYYVQLSHLVIVNFKELTDKRVVT
jgi:hypothetical protein